MSSFGDLRNHKYHGLFGAIIIEPPGAKYYRTLAPVEKNHEVQSVIAAPGMEPFREFVLFAHNGIRMLEEREIWSRPRKRESFMALTVRWTMRIRGKRLQLPIRAVL